MKRHRIDRHQRSNGLDLLARFDSVLPGQEHAGSLLADIVSRYVDWMSVGKVVSR